jgi:hypothetical protein
MRKILVIRFNVLTNEEHYQFVVTFCKMANASAAVKSLLAALLAELELLLEQERLAIDSPHGSLVTAQIKAADKMLDKLLDMVITAIDVAKLSANPALVQAASELLFALKPYGHIQSKKNKAEIGAVKSLLEDLQGKYLPQSTAVGIVQWFDQIQETLATEEDLFAQRHEESARRTQQKKTKDIRQDEDGLYRRAIASLEVAADADAEGVYSQFIADLNDIVRYENTHHQLRNTDIGEATVDSIPDQPFAGKAVTPIPTVRYASSKGETLELTFAKDFTVKYKDNERVGNASLVVYGCGEYEGRKTVTFGIINN